MDQIIKVSGVVVTFFEKNVFSWDFRDFLVKFGFFGLKRC